MSLDVLIFRRLTSGCLFCCWTSFTGSCCNVWVGQRTDDCYFPSQWLSSLPGDQRKTIRPFPIGSAKTKWLFGAWNALATKSFRAWCWPVYTELSYKQSRAVPAHGTARLCNIKSILLLLTRKCVVVSTCRSTLAFTHSYHNPNLYFLTEEPTGFKLLATLVTVKSLLFRLCSGVHHYFRYTKNALILRRL